MRKLYCLAASGALAASLLMAGCSGNSAEAPSIPENTSEEMYEIGCDALEQIDAALDANDLFVDDLQTQLQTLSVKARDVENQQENDAEILEGIQGTAISVSMENGDDAMEYIEQLRDALGQAE